MRHITVYRISPLYNISIHALLWSATLLEHDGIADYFISIHALLWSATHERHAHTSVGEHFYPRTPVECDRDTFSYHPDLKIFLSTHSCGVRLTILTAHIIAHGFLSTHSCGVRHLTLRILTSGKKFLSTHSCGVRHCSRSHHIW